MEKNSGVDVFRRTEREPRENGERTDRKQRDNREITGKEQRKSRERTERVQRERHQAKKLYTNLLESFFW